MKSFAILALHGVNAVQLSRPSDSVFIQKTDGTVTEVVFAQFVDEADEIMKNSELVQMRKVDESKPDFHGYQPWYSGFEGNNHNNGEWRDAYERVVPERFTGDTADTFTAKIIKEYATEGKDEDTHKPNGHFTVTKDQTRQAAVEVLGTHLGLKGDDAESHLKKYFDTVWDHFDVNSVGTLEAIEVNKFMRDLCKPVKEHITLE